MQARVAIVFDLWDGDSQRPVAVQDLGHSDRVAGRYLANPVAGAAQPRGVGVIGILCLPLGCKMGAQAHIFRNVGWVPH